MSFKQTETNKDKRGKERGGEREGERERERTGEGEQAREKVTMQREREKRGR